MELACVQVIRTALAVKEVLPGSIAMLEMHGTGTSLGDPIEVGAAFAVLQPTVDSTAAKGTESQQHSIQCHAAGVY